MSRIRPTRRPLYASIIGTLIAIVGSTRPGLDAAADVNVLTQRNDIGRTGANLQETTLTPDAVPSGQFGLLYSILVDGQVYAQPLYVSNNTVQGRARNIVVVATAHNSVYAFDADTPSDAPLWRVSLGPSAPQDPDNNPDGSTIPNCHNMTPEV